MNDTCGGEGEGEEKVKEKGINGAWRKVKLQHGESQII